MKDQDFFNIKEKGCYRIEKADGTVLYRPFVIERTGRFLFWELTTLYYVRHKHKSLREASDWGAMDDIFSKDFKDRGKAMRILDKAIQNEIKERKRNKTVSVTTE